VSIPAKCRPREANYASGTIMQASRYALRYSEPDAPEPCSAAQRISAKSGSPILQAQSLQVATAGHRSQVPVWRWLFPYGCFHRKGNLHDRHRTRNSAFPKAWNCTVSHDNNFTLTEPVAILATLALVDKWHFDRQRRGELHVSIGNQGAQP
jgi:hypothetical protein